MCFRKRAQLMSPVLGFFTSMLSTLWRCHSKLIGAMCNNFPSTLWCCHSKLIGATFHRHKGASIAVVTKEICANNFKYRVHPIIGRNQNRPCLPSFSKTRQRRGTEYVFLATIVTCMPELNTIFQNNFILHHRLLAICLNFVIWAKLPPIPS